MWSLPTDTARKSARSPQPAQIDGGATLAANVRTYLLNSTLHGLRYVGQTTITWLERGFFAAAFVLVVVLAGYFISNVYEKWRASPIIISLNAAATPITDFPFPAVTICNMNQARRDVVAKFAAGSNDELLLRSLCGTHNASATLEHATDTSWTYFKRFLGKVSRPCKEVLLICQFGTRRQRCADLFKTVLTDEGVCCIFNRVHNRFLLQHYSGEDEQTLFDTDTAARDDLTTPVYTAIDWTAEGGFPDGADRLTTIPRRALGSGSHMGLTVLLDTHVADYYCSSTNSAGLKVLLHPPTETPKIAEYGFAIAPGRESRVTITPQLSDASDPVRDIPLAQRQCIFANEGNLTFFRTYSRKNCEMECESRLVSQECGCVLYYMPRVDENTTICSQDQIDCAAKLKQTIQMGMDATARCDCMPGCFEINYRADVSTAMMSNEFMVSEPVLKYFSPDNVKNNLAIMHIYYEESAFRSNRKKELIGFTEFLSNTGGLLGLFMGFSVVSIIEIVYFLTIRPYFEARRARNGAKTTKRRRRTKDWPIIERIHDTKDGPDPFRTEVVTISKRMERREGAIKPFVVKYRHVSRRLCDMDVK